MSKTLVINFEFEDDELQEVLEREDVQGDLQSWFYAEVCQNHDIGFITKFFWQDE